MSASAALTTSNYHTPTGWSVLETSDVTKAHYSNVHTYKNNSGSVVAFMDIASGARVDMMQYQASGTLSIVFQLSIGGQLITGGMKCPPRQVGY